MNIIKQRLVELQIQADTEDKISENTSQHREFTADLMIRHGITIQNDPDSDFGKWISVKDHLPELLPCSAGTAYSEAVNVLTSGRKVITAIWDGTNFIGDAEFWEAEDEEITHWTPVLLPLPSDSDKSDKSDQLTSDHQCKE